MEIKRLTVNHYDELLSLLDRVFTRDLGRPVDFAREHPKMWIRDEQHIGQHIGAFENGKLCSVVGVYELPASVGGIDCLFTTTGNVATLPEYEGRGFMNAVFSKAMSEAERIGSDACRLSGLRQRYSRFGFEGGGTLYRFVMDGRTRSRRFAGIGEDIAFAPIARDDLDTLRFCLDLSRAAPFHIKRFDNDDLRDVWLIMSSKLKTPYLALCGTEPAGYLCVSEDGRDIAELRAVSDEAALKMVCAWQSRAGCDIEFSAAPYSVGLLRTFADGCDSVTAISPSRFRIINWQKLADAFLKLKASYEPLADGELLLGIKDYGTLRLFVRDGETGCEKVSAGAAFTLDRLAAARLLFGPLPPVAAADLPAFCRGWFPLPLTWDMLDYV